MSAPITPIHVGAVGVANVRFFRAPFDEPHMPWHAVDDLLRAMALDRKLRRHFRACLLRDWAEDTRTIQTDEGKVLIAAHFVAQGLIDSMLETGHVADGFDCAYAQAGGAALTALTQNMSDLDTLNYSVEAFRRTNKMPGPHPKFDQRAITYLPREGRR